MRLRFPQVLGAAFLIAVPVAASPPPDELTLVTDEAEAALAILSRQTSDVDDAAWQRLFTSEGYKLLQRREASMQRSFTYDEFRAFLRAPETIAEAPIRDECDPVALLTDYNSTVSLGGARWSEALLRRLNSRAP
jgi:hypothetical protein